MVHVGSNLGVAIFVLLVQFFFCLVFLAYFFPFSCFPHFSLLSLYSFVRFLDNVFLVIIYDLITIMGSVSMNLAQ